MLQIKLFRGDCLYNHKLNRNSPYPEQKVDTMPENYEVDGIYATKIMEATRPLNDYDKADQLGYILDHIKSPGKVGEINFSHFISFSADESRAKHYAKISNSSALTKLSPSEVENGLVGDHFIFKIEIDGSDPHLKQISNGIYQYSYYSEIKLDNLSLSGKIASLNLQEKRYKTVPVLHQILIVDCVTLLKPVKDNYPEEYRLAESDSEWLILPFSDLIVGENDVQSTLDANHETTKETLSSIVPPAAFWSTDNYYSVERLKETNQIGQYDGFVSLQGECHS